MFGRRGGPLLGMATLLLIAYAGFATSPPMTAPHPNSANKQKGVNHKGEDNESPLGTAWTWLGENHDRIDPLTAIAALVVAVAVAYVTGRLWQATRDLAKSTEDLAKGARDQSAEMKLARELTEKNFMLAEKQLLLAAQQSEFAQKQHGLEREQYLAVHRPRIAIRSIHIERQPNQAILEADKPIKGSLVIVNVGAAEAKIKEADYRFFWGSNLPMAPPLNGAVPRSLLEHILPHKMPGHESCLVQIESSAIPGAVVRDILIGAGPTSLFIIGAIRFSDWNLQDRWMGFCRKYEPDLHGEGRFIAVDNPDYEYED